MNQSRFINEHEHQPPEGAELLAQRIRAGRRVEESDSSLDGIRTTPTDHHRLLETIREHAKDWLIEAGLSKRAAQAVATKLQQKIPEYKQGIVPTLIDHSGLLELQARIELGIESKEELAWTRAALVGAAYAFTTAAVYFTPLGYKELGIEFSDDDVKSAFQAALQQINRDPIIQELVRNERTQHNPNGVKTFLKAVYAPYVESEIAASLYPEIAKHIRDAVYAKPQESSPEIESKYLKLALLTALPTAAVAAVGVYSQIAAAAAVNPTIPIFISGFMGLCAAGLTSYPFLKAGLKTLNEKMVSFLSGGLHPKEFALRKDEEYVETIRDKVATLVGEIFPEELRNLQALPIHHPRLGTMTLGELRIESPELSTFLDQLEQLAEGNIFDRKISIFQLMKLDDALAQIPDHSSSHLVMLRDAVHQRLVDSYPDSPVYNPRPKIPHDLMVLCLDAHFAKKSVDRGDHEKAIVAGLLRERLDTLLTPLAENSVRALHPRIYGLESRIKAIKSNSAPAEMDRVMYPRKSIDRVQHRLFMQNPTLVMFWNGIVEDGKKQLRQHPIDAVHSSS